MLRWTRQPRCSARRNTQLLPYAFEEDRALKAQAPLTAIGNGQQLCEARFEVTLPSLQHLPDPRRARPPSTFASRRSGSIIALRLIAGWNIVETTKMATCPSVLSAATFFPRDAIQVRPISGSFTRFAVGRAPHVRVRVLLLAQRLLGERPEGRGCIIHRRARRSLIMLKP